MKITNFSVQVADVQAWLPWAAVTIGVPLLFVYAAVTGDGLWFLSLVR